MNDSSTIEKKHWSTPEIYFLDFKNTKGGNTTQFGEETGYVPQDPTSGIN